VAKLRVLFLALNALVELSEARWCGACSCSSAYIAMLAEKAKQTREERGGGGALQGDNEVYEAVRPSRTRSVEVPQV
jgi:hypothetical protein